MLVWGIDPGRHLGYAELVDGELGHSGAYDMDPTQRGDALRWDSLITFLETRCEASGVPDLIAMENAGFACLYGPRLQPKQVQAAFGYMTTVELWAVRYQTRAVTYSPTTLKARFGGHGRAKKEQLAQRALELYGRKVAGYDESDAIAAAFVAWEDMCHHQSTTANGLTAKTSV